MFELTCIECGKKYFSERNKDGYCELCRSRKIADSKHKYYENRKHTRAEVKSKLTACEQCGRLFDAKNSAQKLCSICQLLKEREYKMTASNQYRKDNQDVIQFKVPKGRRDELKAYAESQRRTLTTLILDSLRLFEDIHKQPEERVREIYELIYKDHGK